MAPKFRTWTKGDRSHAVSSVRAGDLLHTPERYSPCTPHARGPSSSIDLRASMISPRATDFLTQAFNDTTLMPCDPLQSSKPTSSLIVPRPRLRANSAPWRQWPDGHNSNMAELQGSTPLPQDIARPSTTRPDVHYSDFRHSHTYPGISRPRSSPQNGSHNVFTDTILQRAGNTFTSFDLIKPTNDHFRGQFAGQESLQTLHSIPVTYTAVPQPHPSYSGFQHDQHQDVMTMGFGVIEPGSSHIDISEQNEHDEVLLKQITALRATHEAHITSLKDTHAKELASHTAYISFLERQSALIQVRTPSTAPQMPFLLAGASFSEQKVVPMCELPAHDTHNGEKRVVKAETNETKHDSAIEIESLRRQLSQVKKNDGDVSRLSQQYNQLREAYDQRDTTIAQMSETLKKAEETEASLRNTIDGLEAQLIAANNERLDVLEGFHEVCQKLELRMTALPVRALSPKHSSSCPDLSQSSMSPVRADAPLVNGHEGTFLDDEDSARIAELEAQLSAAQTTIQEQDEKITELRSSHRVRQSSDAHNTARFVELQARLDKQEAALRKADADRDQYDALLQKELRRQTRQSIRPVATSPSVDMQTFVRLQGIVADAKFTADGVSDKHSLAPAGSTFSDLLEKQLEQALKETINHKLEIRGLKKDLKKAHTDLSALRAISTPRPPTPDTETNPSSAADTRLHARKRNVSQTGLGIVLTPAPRIRSKTVGTATAEALKPNSSPSLVDIKRAVRRPRTPLAAHKELPKPPAVPAAHDSPLSSPLIVNVQRADTVRSISDSIISSYAQRTQDEQIKASAAIDSVAVAQSMVASTG